MSGRFAGRTNEWCFKVFMACDDDIRNALESLDRRLRGDLSQEGYDRFVRFAANYTRPTYTPK